MNLKYCTNISGGRPLSRGAAFLAASAVLLACGSSLSAQSTAAAGTTEGEPVRLSVFEVSGQMPNRYQPADTTSGGRVRTNIFDSPQSINVVTSELINDVGAARMVDALKYLPGLSESALPYAGDYITVRGFQVTGYVVDGYYGFFQQNVDPVLLDRIEVVKGPSAILAPTGSPGGTVNGVSKKPLFTAQSSLTVQAGTFNAGSIEVDSTGRIGGANSKWAYRVVAALRDYDLYYDDAEFKGFVVAPALTYRFSPETQLTLQLELKDQEGVTNYLGIPIDPSSGSTNEATFLSGVSPKLNVYHEDQVRKARGYELRGLFTSQLTEHLSTRVAGRYNEDFSQAYQITLSGVPGGAYDPRTGLWTPGVVYGPGPTFTPSPAPTSRNFARGGIIQTVDRKYTNFQNDWIYQRTFSGAESTTAAGFAYTGIRPNGSFGTKIEAITSPVLNIDAPTRDPFTKTGVVTQKIIERLNTYQFYANESLTLFAGKLLLSAGVSNINIDNETPNLLTGQVATTDQSTNSYNYGVVFKPVPTVSVYYGHSENAAPILTSLSAAGTPPFSEGAQDEFGARVALLDNHLQASVAYFDITQSSFGVPNPGNLTVPPPNPPLPLLFSDRTAKGWEFALTWELVKGVTLIANYTDFKNRDVNNVPFRSTPERSGAFWLRYEFLDGGLKNFSVSVGANYLDQRPGDAASGYTAASTPTNVIPNQPSFWLPARTVVDMAAAYRYQNWHFQVNVDNVFDEDYMAASLTRYLVTAGPGVAVRGSITYKF